MPNAEGARSEQPVVHSSEQVAANTKEMLNGSVHRENPLRVSGRFEAAHLPLPLAGRLVPSDIRADRERAGTSGLSF